MADTYLSAVLGLVRTKPGRHTPLGQEQVTALSSAENLPDIPADAAWAVIIPEGNDVRWRDDGTDPTDSIGMPLSISQPLTYSGDLEAIKFIQQGAGAKLNVAYYR